jgi:hypothetical protein
MWREGRSYAAQGFPLISADGVPSVMSTGSPAVDSGSGCECCGDPPDPGPPCGQCIDNLAPSGFTVLLFDYTSCIGTCVIDPNVADRSWKWTGTAPIGPWDVPATGACSYFLSTTYSSLLWEYFGGTVCDPGELGTDENGGFLEITVTLSAAGPFCQVELFSETGQVSGFLFQGLLPLTPDYDCMISRELPDDLTTDCFDGMPVYGATALIVPY